MRLFLTTDWHFGVYPLQQEKWLRMMKQYFYEFYIPLLKKESKEGDVCIMLGDMYDNRTHLTINVMNFVDQLVEDISEIMPMHMLIGNHDIWNKASNDINSPKPLKRIPNVTIYEETTVVEIGGKKCLMMPWVEKKEDQVELLKDNAPCDYLFCHSDLNGCKMHLSSVAHRNLNKIELSEFKAYARVYSGHIHLSQKSGNFTYIGSPYEMDRNDMHNKKGVTIVDMETGEEDFILNTVSPKFKKLSILNEDDIDKLDDVDTVKDYVDLSISNSLLISNRKMRRKLEKILEVSSFSSVDYVNDLVKDDEETPEEMVDVELTDFSNFITVIIDYIGKQEYETDEIKDGILSEFDDIVEIYNENYTKKDNTG